MLVVVRFEKLLLAKDMDYMLVLAVQAVADQIGESLLVMDRDCMPESVEGLVHNLAVVVGFEQDLARLMPLRFAKKLGHCLYSPPELLDIPGVAPGVEVELGVLVELAFPILKLQ